MDIVIRIILIYKINNCHLLLFLIINLKSTFFFIYLFFNLNVFVDFLMRAFYPQSAQFFLEMYFLFNIRLQKGCIDFYL